MPTTCSRRARAENKAAARPHHKRGQLSSPLRSNLCVVRTNSDALFRFRRLSSFAYSRLGVQSRDQSTRGTVRAPRSTAESRFAFEEGRFLPGRVSSRVDQVAVRERAVASSSGEGARLMSAKLQQESSPTGADIAIDGSFVGNAASDLQATGGEHTVSVKKAGFKDWERKVKVSGGSSIRLGTVLEKTQNQ